MRSPLVWMIALFAGLSWIVCWEELQIVGMRRELEGARVELAATKERLSQLAGSVETAGTQIAEVGKRLADAARAQSSAEERLLSLGDGLRRRSEAPQRPDPRAAILADYAEPLSRLSVPPETLAKLKDLLVARGLAAQDAKDAALKEGLAEGSPAMAQAVVQATAEANREIARLAGPDESRFRLAAESASQKTERR